MGQSYFFYLWPQKLYRAFRFGKCLDQCWFSSWLGNFRPLVATNTRKADLSRAPRQRKVFWAFFHMFWDMNLKPGIYIRYVVWHIKFECHCNKGFFDPLYDQIYVQFLFLHTASSIISVESFKYGTYTYKIESFSPLLLLLCNCIHS